MSLSRTSKRQLYHRQSQNSFYLPSLVKEIVMHFPYYCFVIDFQLISCSLYPTVGDMKKNFTSISRSARDIEITSSHTFQFSLQKLPVCSDYTDNDNYFPFHVLVIHLQGDWKSFSLRIPKYIVCPEFRMFLSLEKLN